MQASIFRRCGNNGSQMFFISKSWKFRMPRDLDIIHDRFPATQGPQRKGIQVTNTLTATSLHSGLESCARGGAADLASWHHEHLKIIRGKRRLFMSFRAFPSSSSTHRCPRPERWQPPWGKAHTFPSPSGANSEPSSAAPPGGASASTLLHSFAVARQTYRRNFFHGHCTSHLCHKNRTRLLWLPDHFCDGPHPRHRQRRQQLLRPSRRPFSCVRPHTASIHPRRGLPSRRRETPPVWPLWQLSQACAKIVFRRPAVPPSRLLATWLASLSTMLPTRRFCRMRYLHDPRGIRAPKTAPTSSTARLRGHFPCRLRMVAVLHATALDLPTSCRGHCKMPNSSSTCLLPWQQWAVDASTPRGGVGWRPQTELAEAAHIGGSTPA